MGHPKQQSKKYARPMKPYSKERLVEEKKLMERYGLKRKRELWRAQEFVRDVRRRSMQLLASNNQVLKNQMIEKLYNLGIVNSGAQIDDVLSLDVEKLLGRRLQSVVQSKGLAKTAKHSRQIIVHRLIEVDGRRIQQPGFIVTRGIEDKIKLIEKAKKPAKAKETEKTEEKKAD